MYPGQNQESHGSYAGKTELDSEAHFLPSLLSS